VEPAVERDGMDGADGDGADGDDVDGSGDPEYGIGGPKVAIGAAAFEDDPMGALTIGAGSRVRGAIAMGSTLGAGVFEKLLESLLGYLLVSKLGGGLVNGVAGGIAFGGSVLGGSVLGDSVFGGSVFGGSVLGGMRLVDGT